MELVSYIHLNPLRAKLVSDLYELDCYRFCGHFALMGKCRSDWQDTDYVLKPFGKRTRQSRKRYREFVQQRIAHGRRAGNERLERRAFLQAAGYDFDRLVKRVAALFEMPTTEVLREGSYARTVEARSVLCFWANRELGISTVELALRLKIAQPTVTQSVARGEKLVAEKKLLMSIDM